MAVWNLLRKNVLSVRNRVAVTWAKNLNTLNCTSAMDITRTGQPTLYPTILLNCLLVLNITSHSFTTMFCLSSRKVLSDVSEFFLGYVYACVTCKSSFKHSGTLRRHVKYYCGRRPPRVTGYNQSESGYECQRCGKMYRKYCTMRRHLVHECGKEPSIECPVYECNYKAKFNSRITQHCRMVHKIDIWLNCFVFLFLWWWWQHCNKSPCTDCANPKIASILVFKSF